VRVALKVAYLGDNYYGFQRQPEVPTVEAEIKEALEKIGVPEGKFGYAGRTDRGVNALGQVIDFEIGDDKEALTYPRPLNGRLPRDVWTWARSLVPENFDSRYSALWREYLYILYHQGLDMDVVRSGAHKLLGEHDFRNFSSCKEDTVREILGLEVREKSPNIVVFQIKANGFLWNMVRKIVCSLEAVGSGETDLSWIDDLLNPEINEGAPTAPAEGLILKGVGYEGISWQVDDYSRKRAAKALSSVVKCRMASSYAAKALQDSMTSSFDCFL
jgi:tRNA pseudouridine38-40 synthase